jgi:UrcA family protein
MKTFFIPLAAIAAIALGATPAAAQSAPAGARTLVVHYADLDLGTKAGLAKLDSRIRVAVRTACGTASDVDVAGKNDVQQCRTDTLANAAAQRDQAVALADRSTQVRLAAQ